MSIGKADLDRIKAAVDEQVRTTLKQQAKVSSTTDSAGGTTRWMKDWQVPAIFAGIVAVILGIVVTEIISLEHFRGQVEASLAQIKEVKDGIGSVQKDVSDLRDQVTALKIQVLTAQPIAQFRSHLSELQPSLQQATRQRSKIPPAVITDLQKQLQAVGTDAPGYWPVVADFVSYRSTTAASWTIKADLPHCRDTKPSEASFDTNMKVNGEPAKLSVPTRGYQSCQFAMDSPLDGNWLNAMLVGKTTIIFFRQCAIIYNGGQITVRLDLARGERVADTIRKGSQVMVSQTVNNSVNFIDCIFAVSAEQSPSEQAKQLTAFLLNQTTTTIALPTKS